MHFVSLANSGIQELTPYQPGKPTEELQRELGLTEIVKLASNENPFGPSSESVEAMQKAMLNVARYPEGSSYQLREKLASKLGVNPNQLTFGNGSNDVLELIARVFANQSSEVIFSQYCFAVYPLATRAIGAKAVEVPAVNWGHDLQAMAKAVTPDTKIIFIANPNNPTGTWFRRDELETFLSQVPQSVIIVLDEAYCEYITEPDYPNGLDYLADHPNVIVTRTFSKAYGLAGLRVGYSISHPEVADLLNRVRQPFNVNLMAQVAAVAALGDVDYLQKGVQANSLGLKQLEQGFKSLGLNYIPSVGNFISFDTGRNGLDVYQKLLHRGVIVRPVANYSMPSHLRVSVGLESENEKFLTALSEVMKDLS